MCSSVVVMQNDRYFAKHTERCVFAWRPFSKVLHFHLGVPRRFKAGITFFVGHERIMGVNKIL